MSTPIRLVCLGLLALSLSIGAPLELAHAQGSAQIKPSREQKSLNARGLKAHKAEQYTKAAELFRAGLAVGDLNILYFNLGRALQKNGDCKGADEAFEKGLGAPHVTGIDPVLIEGKTREYRQELRKTCPGTLIVECSDPAITVKVNEEPQSCGEPISLPSGKHAVWGELEGEVFEAEVSVVSLEEVTQKVSIERKVVEEVEVIEPPEVVVPPEETMSAMTMTGWVLVGVGGASLITGGVFGVLTDSTNAEIATLAEDAETQPIDTAKAKDLIDSANSYETIQIVGYSLGAASLIGGAVLLLLDAQAEQSETPAVRIAPIIAEDGAGASLELSF